VLAAGPEVRAEDIERHVLPRLPPKGGLPTLDLDRLEELAIREALARHGGSKRAAALTLGIALKTLYNKLDRLQPKGEAQAGEPDGGKEP
jgi:DNA-binding NtrC family response regulator